MVGTTYGSGSDYRLKENVVNISDGITRVKQLSPRRFNFIADADTTVDGFLAHEAQTEFQKLLLVQKMLLRFGRNMKNYQMVFLLVTTN